VIRQAISCDICGAEKKLTNHWFVAYEQDGELRVSGWNSHKRLRPESKHLCGQTCLHKLMDDFLAWTLAARAPQAEGEAVSDAREKVMARFAKTDTSLTSDAAFDEFESSARLIPTPAPVAPARPPLRMPVELIPVPARPAAPAVISSEEELPRYASRNWRAAAWERERERELRAGERHASPTARRRFN
jgi:hypothetical protein